MVNNSVSSAFGSVSECKVTTCRRLVIELYRVLSTFIELYASEAAKIWPCRKKIVYLQWKSNMFNPLNSFSLCTTNKPVTPPHSTVSHLPSATFRTSCHSQPGQSSADGSSPTHAWRASSPVNPALLLPPRLLSFSQSSGNRKSGTLGTGTNVLSMMAQCVPVPTCAAGL